MTLINSKKIFEISPYCKYIIKDNTIIEVELDVEKQEKDLKMQQSLSLNNIEKAERTIETIEVLG